MRGIDKFARIAQDTRSKGQEAHEFTGAIVSGINADGTVDLRYLGEDHPSIDCMANYTNRLVGDVVMVRDNGIMWMVLGKIGGENESVPNISWGNGNPVGSDWSAAATSIKVRENQIYIQGTAFSSSVPTPQAIHEPSSDRAYQGGVWNHAFSGRPAQGIESSGLFGSGTWAGGWYYDNRIIDAVTPKAVRSMELRIERGAEPFGLDEAIVPKIYVHNSANAAATEPANVAGPYYGTPLEIGQSAWWQVPAAVIALFNTSAIKGFHIKADTADEFMVMAEYCGQVRITN